MRHIALLLSAAAALLPAVASAGETVTYGYDAKGRLVTVSHSGSVNNGVSAAYTFDKADNRNSVAVAGAVTPVIVVPLAGFSLIPTR